MSPLAWVHVFLLASALTEPVGVFVEPFDAPAAEAIVEACNTALASPRCVIERDPALAGVSVALREPFERASVAFVQDGMRETPRVLELGSADPIAERWRAIGLVIAARIVERDAEAKARTATPVQAVAAQPAEQPPQSAHRSFGLETSLMLGQGLDDDLRAGVRVRGLVRLHRDVPISALLALRFNVSMPDAQPSARWLSIGPGLQGAVPIVRDALELELYAEAALQWVHVTLEDRASGETDSGSEQRYGAVAGVQLAYSPSAWWSAVAGVESSVIWPALIVEARSSEVAEEEPLRLALHLGQRLSF